MWCYYTCRIAFYCSSHLAGSVSSADIVLKNIQYDVGPISFPTSSLSRFPTWSRCRPDVVSNVEPFRYRPDVGPISFPTSNFCGFQTSARCRPDIVDDIEPTCKHGVGPISADICRYRPDIFCRHQAAVVADICRYRADIEPLWFSEIGPTSSQYRPDVGLISLTTSGRYRPDIFCRHQAAVVADICRYRADIEPLWFSDIGLTSSLYRPDVGLISLTTSGRHRAHVQTWSRPDISRHLPISARYNFRHLPISGRHLADRFVLSGTPQ